MPRRDDIKKVLIIEKERPDALLPNLGGQSGLNLSSALAKAGVLEKYGVKEAVFPFNTFPEVGPVIGPEMRSTGEVLGIADSFGMAFFKSQEGAHAYFRNNGISSNHIPKMHEGRPSVVDAITNGEIQLVINTPVGKLSQHDDSYIRKSAIKYKIPYITTLAGAAAAAKGIETYRSGKSKVKSLQAYHADIR